MSEILYEKAIKLVRDVNDLAKLIKNIQLKNMYNDGIKKFELILDDQEQLQRFKNEITLNARSLNTLLNLSRSGRSRKFKDYTGIHDINFYLVEFLGSPCLRVLKQLEIAVQYFQEDTDLFFFPVMKRDHIWSSYSKIAKYMLVYRRSPMGYKEIKFSAIEAPLIDQDLSVPIIAADKDFELKSETPEIRARAEKLSKIDLKEEKQPKLIDLQLDEQEFDTLFAAVAAEQKSVPENKKDEDDNIAEFVRTSFNTISQNNLKILDTGFSMLYAKLRNLKLCFFDFIKNEDGEECNDKLKKVFLDTHKIKKKIRTLIGAIEDKFDLELSEDNVLIRLNIRGVEQRDKKEIFQYFVELLEEAHHLYRLAYFKYVNIEKPVEENQSASEQRVSSVRSCSGM